jgi:hypothetical protein
MERQPGQTMGAGVHMWGQWVKNQDSQMPSSEGCLLLVLGREKIKQTRLQASRGGDVSHKCA